MTNKEAVERIRDFGLYHAIGDLPHSTKTVEAFEMAISALEAQDVSDTNVGDMVSRQAVIRIAERGQIQGFQWQIEQLVKLPSAQPELYREDDAK